MPPGSLWILCLSRAKTCWGCRENSLKRITEAVRRDSLLFLLLLMNREGIIRETEEYVRKTLSGEGSGHDWWHVYRVWKNAVFIGKKEQADLFVIQLAALLHDIADWKFNDGDEHAGPRAARAWLEKLQVNESVILHVCQIIGDLSFKGAGVKTPMKTIEGKVVQDADRLDAIGAIGIARAFAYGGHKNREIHDPGVKPEMHATFEAYKKAEGTTINHFHEKLLLLKDLMNTGTAREIASERHLFMEQYLGRFYDEWEGGV